MATAAKLKRNTNRDLAEIARPRAGRRPHGMVAAEVESEHARRAWFRLRHAAG